MKILEEFEQELRQIPELAFLPCYKEGFSAKTGTAWCIYEYAGTAGHPQTRTQVRQFQFVTRSESTKEARELCQKIYLHLSTDTGMLKLLSGRIITITPKQSPFKLRVDEQNNIYYGFNISTVAEIRGGN